MELNDIVEEVKDSEEWEAVKMNILEIGIEKGMQQGAEKKMLELVEKKLKKDRRSRRSRMHWKKARRRYRKLRIRFEGQIPAVTDVLQPHPK